MTKIIIAILIILGCFVTAQAQADDSVFLRLKANKKSIKTGDELQLDFTIKNASEKTYLFSILNNSLAHPLIITDDRSQPYPWFYTIFYELKYVPDKEDLFLLKPGEERIFTFSFILQKEAKSFYGYGENSETKFYQGYFLFYPKYKSYIYLADSKKIIIQARYEPSDGDREGAKRLQLTDLYEGALKSETIEIAIEE